MNARKLARMVPGEWNEGLSALAWWMTMPRQGAPVADQGR